MTSNPKFSQKAMLQRAEAPASPPAAKRSKLAQLEKTSLMQRELVPVAHSYDLILTSETVYSPASMHSLVALLEASMARPHGIALVAAKTYYFGVGGGTRDFEALLQARGVFDSKVKHVFIRFFCPYFLFSRSCLRQQPV